MRFLLKCGLLLLFIPALTGCGCFKRDKSIVEGPASAGSFKIMESDLNYRLQARYGRQEMTQMVTEEIVKAFAKKHNVYPTEADVDTELANYKKLTPNWQQIMNDAGMNEKDLRARQELDLTERRIALKGVTATEADAKKIYELVLQKEIPPIVQRESRQLFLLPCKTGAEASEALSQLRQGASWTTVLNNFSTNEELKKQKGELGFVTRDQTARLADGRVVKVLSKEIEDATFKLKEGGFSEPITVKNPQRTDYVIVHVRKIRPKSVMKWEDSKYWCSEQARREKVNGDKALQDQARKIGEEFQKFRDEAMQGLNFQSQRFKLK